MPLIARTKPDGSLRCRAAFGLRDVEPFTSVELWAWRALTTRSALAMGTRARCKRRSGTYPRSSAQATRLLNREIRPVVHCRGTVK